MARDERAQNIQAFEDQRDGRLAIVYVTSTRVGFEVKMADDVLPLFHAHLEAARDRAKKGVDVIIHSNGGHGTVPWRLANLIREYTDKLCVVVPHHAFSAATLLALGADEILMHRMGCLGPIDPSVANEFNPPNSQNPSQLSSISVEDVSAYFKLVKDDVGITHEDELVDTFRALTDKIHPLALGNVQRSHHQSRMMARKLLKLHVATDKEHEIGQIIENLKSNLFFHGHPINRREARDDLKLKVEDVSAVVEEKMWGVYSAYANEMKLEEPLNLLREHDLAMQGSAPAAAPPPPTVPHIVAMMQQLAQAGLGIGAVTPAQLVEIASAMLPIVSGQAPPAARKARLTIAGAYVESRARGDVHLTDLAIEKTLVQTPAGPQDAVKHEVVWQRWEEAK